MCSVQFEKENKKKEKKIIRESGGELYGWMDYIIKDMELLVHIVYRTNNKNNKNLPTQINLFAGEKEKLFFRKIKIFTNT